MWVGGCDICAGVNPGSRACCVCVMSVQVSIEAEEGMKFPETGVTGGFKPGNWTHSLEEQLILSQPQCPSDPPASISPVLRLEVYDPLPVHGVLGAESRASCMLGEAVHSELHPQVFSVVVSEILLKQKCLFTSHSEYYSNVLRELMA